MLLRVEMLRRIVPCLLVAVLLAPHVASAANGNKPRIPVVWSDAACITVVDRSATPVVHFDYVVPMEDDPEAQGGRTADEVDDSRTHQFFAFRKLDFASVNSTDKLPRWVTQSDIDRAAEVDPMVVAMETAGIPPAEILDGGPRFAASEWLRITADDARVPITNAQAAMGVDWDLSAVEPGTWTVWGYTWEPVLNVWSERPGFIKVIASAAEADAAGPAIALLSESPDLSDGAPHAIPGCVDAPAGSTITLEWGEVVGSVEPEWRPVVEDEPVSTGMLDLEVVLPDADPGDGMALVKRRATVTDPSGKSYVAYSPGTYTVGRRAPEEDGCQIAPAHTAPGGLAVLVPLFAFGLRRRRRGARLRS